jgi:hypothetical protein
MVLVSQLPTLYITPVYYVYIEGLRLRLARRRVRVPPEKAVAGQAPVGRPLVRDILRIPFNEEPWS